MLSEQLKKIIFVAGSNSFIVYGRTEIADLTPYVKDSCIFASVEDIACAFGLNTKDNIYWDQDSQTIYFIKGGVVVWFEIGKPFLTINGATILMPTEPEVKSGFICLPVRYLAWGLGYDAVEWEDNEYKIVITPQS